MKANKNLKNLYLMIYLKNFNSIEIIQAQEHHHMEIIEDQIDKWKRI
jgi:hypothetical protein